MGEEGEEATMTAVKLEDLSEKLRADAAGLIADGTVTQQIVDDTLAFMNMLAEEELAGRVTHEQAQEIITLFATWQVMGGKL